MGALIVLAILVFGIVAVVIGIDRYRPRTAASAYTLPTTEVLVDPESGRRQRVHVDPVTGQRAYVDEPVPMPGTPQAPLARPGLVGTPPTRYVPGVPPGGGYVLPPGAPPPGLAAPVDETAAPAGATPPDAIPGGPPRG